jgi:hypothetical protein
VVEIEMAKPAKNSDGSLNTKIVAMQTKYFLYKNSVGQECFAKINLGRNKSFKKYINEPVVWADCTRKERHIYRCCLEWVNADDEAVARLKKESKAYFEKKIDFEAIDRYYMDQWLLAAGFTRVKPTETI